MSADAPIPIPLEALEAEAWFTDDSPVGYRLSTEITVSVFEEMLWLAGQFSPQSIQVSRESEHMTTAQITAEDVIRRFPAWLEDGFSIALNYVERLNGGVARRIDEIGRSFRCPANGSLFLSPPGGATFRPHYDAIDVLAFQLDGAKIWKIGDAPTSLPLVNNTYNYEEAGAFSQQYRLTPGAMLYVPRGKVHDVSATGDDLSLHLSLGLASFNHAAVMKKLVDMTSERVVALRRSNLADNVRGRSHGYPNDDLVVPPFDRYALATAARSLYASALSRQPQPPGRLSPLTDSGGITAQTMVRRRTACEVTCEYLDSGTVCIGFPGLAAGRFSQSNAFLSFPQSALVALEHVRDAESGFSADELRGLLSTDEKLVIVRRLLKEGLLTGAGLDGDPSS